jgi:hypothetical protein
VLAPKPTVVVRKPVGVNCSGQGPHVVGSIFPAKGATPRCRGVMGRITLSRLEEGLGHEGFECDKCGRRVKYVPPERS